MWCRFLVASLTGLLLLSAEVLPATASGPWRAQVVDAETKQPLEGVVVLAVWTRHVRSLGGPSSEYHDSDEVLTDKEGRFAIATRSFFSLNPMVFFRGPEFLIFKPGYGRWNQYARYPIASGTKGRYEHDLLSQNDIVVELPQLRSLEERRQYVGRATVGFDPLPIKKTPLLNKAIREERLAVGYRD